MITAPFNFVPLSEKVFIPEWGEWVSHDIRSKMERVERSKSPSRRRVRYLSETISMRRGFATTTGSTISRAVHLRGWCGVCWRL